jgi:hypothetical protein
MRWRIMVRSNSAKAPVIWEQAAHRCGGVDVMLIEVEVDAGGPEMLNGAEQIDQRAAEPIDGPGHHDVEPPAARVLQHGVQARSLVAALGAADAGEQAEGHGELRIAAASNALAGHMEEAASMIVRLRRVDP